MLPTTDRRQTDGRATAYSEREREFMFAKNVSRNIASLFVQLAMAPFQQIFGGGGFRVTIDFSAALNLQRNMYGIDAF